mgnify:CR=1 FL=1
MKQFIFNHTNENTAFLVNNYPYGFRLRTKIRYWIETNKKGDRLISQTLNPKTNLWNKPKTSVYSSIAVMFVDDNNYLKYQCVNIGWDNEEKFNAFIQEIGGLNKLNDQQKEQRKIALAVSRTQKYVKVNIVNATGWTDQQSKEHKEKQEQIKREERSIRRKLHSAEGKLAEVITGFSGSMNFVYLHIFVFTFFFIFQPIIAD